MSIFKERYIREKDNLKQRLGYRNINEVPRLEKIVINMGVGGLIQKSKSKTPLEVLQKDMAAICGQKPLITKARKSIASFHIRRGQQVGLKVTLRGKRMYDFLYKVVSVVLPRIRDFRGLSCRQFDRFGNYSFSIPDQGIFPEIDPTKITVQNGMDITFTIRNKKPSDSLELLKLFEFPLRDVK